MKPVIYIDTLFLINFIFNTVIFYIGAYLLKKDIKPLRLIFGSIAASVYGTAVFFPKIHILYTGAAKLFFTVLFSLILFGRDKWKNVLKNTAVCFFAALVFGGSVWIIISLFNIKLGLGAIISNGIIYMDINPLILLGGIAAGTFFLIFFSVVARKNARKIYNLKITLSGRTIPVKGLYDTGCTLSYKNEFPAVIVDGAVLRESLGEEFFEKNEFAEMEYSTVGREKEKISAVFPQRIEDENGKSYKGIVAVGRDNLGASGEYNAVLNPAIFNI